MWTRPTKLRDAARVAPVEEVSLICAADGDYWRQYLEAANLHPTLVGGQARLLISGTSTRFLGIPFRELIIAVYVAREAGSEQRAGAFLLQAYNSVWAFAWIERTIFATPYDYGQIQVTGEPFPNVELKIRGRGVATFSTDSVSDATTTEHWSGPIFLPGRDRNPLNSENLFYADISGATRIFPATGKDRLAFSDELPIASFLRESDCRPLEWHLRARAEHAKSVTMRRQQLDN